MSPTNVTDLTGRSAAVLSAVEVGLGSVLHGFRVPFTGHFLSLNQAFLLSRASLQARGLEGARTMPAQVSAIAASLKSLSPAGKKLTPMLAISAQGLLFSVGTLIAGANFPGILLGSLLLSVWAFVQPILIYYALYGRTMIEVADYFYEKTREAVAFEPSSLLAVLAVILGVKLALAAGVAVLAWRLPESRAKAFQDTLLVAARGRKRAESAPGGLSQSAKLAARDLFNPLFIVSLALTAVFFLFVEASSADLIWALVRPIAVGFILFFAVRAIPFGRVLDWAERKGFTGFSAAFRQAVRTLKELG